MNKDTSTAQWSSRKQMLFRCFIVILSNIVMGSGSGILRMTHFGVDPFSGFTLGASLFFRGPLHVSFMTTGVFQVLLNVLLILFVFITNRHYIGFGTIINMFFLGFVADGAEKLGYLLLGSDFTLPGRILILVVGVVMIAMGVGVYSAADMGVGPYDALPYIISKMTGEKIHVRYERMINDCFCVILAVACAIPVGKITTVVGVATIFLALGLGPLNYFFKVHLGENFLLKHVSITPQ